MKLPTNKALTLIILLNLALFSCQEAMTDKTKPFSQWDNVIKDSFYFLEDNAQPVSDLISDIYSRNNTLLWRDSALIAEDLTLLKLMIPLLYNNGVHEISCWFISPRIKTTLDLFLTEKEVETTAQQLHFLSVPDWGYQEYIEFIDSVRHFNMGLAEDQPPMLLTPYSKESGDSERKRFVITGEDDFSSDYKEREVPLLELYKPSFNEKKEVIVPYDSSMELLIHHRGRDKMFFSFLKAGFPLESGEPVHPDDAMLVAGFASDMNIITPVENFITKENRDYALRIMNLRYKKTAASLNRKTAGKFKKERENLSDQTLSF